MAHNKREIRVGTIQFSPKYKALEDNRKKLLGFFDEAVDQRAHILVCPEMSLSGYIFKDKEDLWSFAEEEKGETFQLFSEYCLRHGLYITYGYVEISGDRLYNSQNLINPKGELALKYRKVNLFESDLNWAEKGDLSYVNGSIENIKVGLGICMDLNADHYVHYQQASGTEMILFSANWLWSSGNPLDYWLQRWKPFDGLVFFSNRIGKEFNTSFCGHSFVMEKGNIVAVCPENRESLLVTSHLFPLVQ